MQPIPAAARPSGPQAARVDHPVEFSATGAEYFRIWIVNVALTVVTLGIYSAWATVRNKQYLYASTRIAGGGFEFTANPINILKGRLLVLGVIVAYQLAAAFQPAAALALAVLIIPLVPWVVVKAVGFNLRYSAYRGLRFHFDGRYWEAFRVYLLWTLGAVASFGLLYPYVAWRRKRFLVERARYGRTGFEFGGEVGWFYLVYIIAYLAYAGVMVAAGVLVTGLLAAVAAGAGVGLEGADPEDAGTVLAGLTLGVAVLISALFGLSYVALNAGVQAMIANHVWQHTRIADVRFDLRLELWQVVWIQASNVVAIVLSAGLLIPWAKVRMLRYRLSRFTLRAVPQDLERFLAAQREHVEATGAEMGDALDLDLGL